MQIGRSFYFNDRSNNFLAYDYGKNVQNSMPLDSILITQGWSSPFVFEYFEHVLLYRPDLLVVVDYKGTNLNRATKEQWEVPLFSTVLIETPNFHYSDYSVWGPSYRFDTKDKRSWLEPEPWSYLTLTRHYRHPMHHDFHGRALISKYHYMYGEKCLVNSRDIMANHKFALAERIGEDNNLVLSNLSGIYFRTGNYHQAERLARKSIEQDPGFYQAHHNLGNALLKLGKYKEAIEHFNKGKGRQIALGRSHQALGFGYLKSGNYRLAEREFRLALRFNPQSFEIRNNLGVVYLNQGKLDKAEKLFDRLRTEYSDNAEISNNLGLLKYKQNDFAAAEKYFRAALEQQNDHSRAWANLSIVVAEDGKFREALVYMQKAIEIDKNDTLILNNMGLLQLKMDNTEEARRYWRRSLSINPDQLRIYDYLKTVDGDVGKGVSSLD